MITPLQAMYLPLRLMVTSAREAARVMQEREKHAEAGDVGVAAAKSVDTATLDVVCHMWRQRRMLVFACCVSAVLLLSSR